MDNKRFDALTRALAEGTSRRNVLKGLIGGVFGGAAVATRLDNTGAQGCTVVEECEDGNPCTVNTCDGGTCTNPWIQGCCTSSIECEDNNPCTTNTCVANACTNPWIEGCCTSAIECEDNNPCTTNTCVANACTNPWIDGCCTSELECATPPDICTGISCIDNACVVEGGCPGETQPSTWTICCPQQSGTCAECCDDSDCASGEICENASDRGLCVAPTTTTLQPTTTTPSACLTRLDCENVQQPGCPDLCPAGSQPGNNRALAGVCCQGEGDSNGTCCSNSCTNGVCDAVVTTTTAAPTTTTAGCKPLESYCYAGAECCSGCCGQDVGIGIPPNQYCLPAEYCECREFGEECGFILNGTFLAGETHQLDCCEGLICFDGHHDEASYCAECRRDHHCEWGYHCCEGRCISDGYCCSDHDCGDCEACYQGSCEPTGVPFGEYCSQVTISEGGSHQGDCCDGLVCCDVEKDGERCFECCGDWDCPKGSECKHGVCESECKHDKDCGDGTCCCKSGHCSKHCCDRPHKTHKPHKPGTTDDDDTYVDTLPSTGSGDTATNAGWMGAAALGAAAYLAGKVLRDGHTPVTEPDAEE